MNCHFQEAILKLNFFLQKMFSNFFMKSPYVYKVFHINSTQTKMKLKCLAQTASELI